MANSIQLDPDAAATGVGNHLRAEYLDGLQPGLEAFSVSPIELPVLMGFAYAQGIGSPRWPLARWVDAVFAWISARAGLAKGRSGDSASKAYPNWLSPPEIEAWRYARERAGLRITGIEDSVRARLRSVLADTITLQLGQDRERAIAHMTERMTASFSGLEKDWRRIATTEFATAFNEGVVVAAASAGIRQFSIVIQSDACQKCRETYPMGAVYTLAEVMKVAPPLHPNCVLPGTKVSTCGVIAAIRAPFDGEVVGFETRAGHALTVALNHPLLTQRGLVAAHEVHEGDYLVRCPGADGGTGPDDDDAVALIEDVFEALRVSSGVAARTVPAAPEHLHGDGRFVDGEIDVVWADGFLRAGGYAALSEQSSELPLVMRLPPGTFNTQSAIARGLLGLARSAYSSMSGGGVGEALLGGGLGHANEHAFATVPLRDPDRAQVTDDRRALHPEVIGDGLHREVFDKVQMSEVVRVNRQRYSGHVYDLQTIYGLYSANTLAVSNCRCVVVPVGS